MERRRLSRNQKSAKAAGAEIFWLNEASIRSDDPLMRTWGLKGQTPIVKTSGQRQGINATSALPNSCGFWCRVFSGRFNAEVFIDSLKDLIKNRKKPIYVITVGHLVHKSRAVAKFIKENESRLRLFIFPPYAPD